MDCEMRPSELEMLFSVSTLWNTCTSKVLATGVPSLYGATVTVRVAWVHELLNPRSEIVHNVHTALVDPDRGLKNSSWGVFGSPRAPVASERAPRAYLVVGGCCVGFKWHFSVKMARWSTPRVPFRGTRGVFWGAREVARKPKRTVLKL